MNEIYNYKENIKIATTPNGDKVIVMNKEIFTSLRNCIYDAAEQRKQQGYEATAYDTMKMWAAFCDKNQESEK